jgi:hypothetical protein
MMQFQYTFLKSFLTVEVHANGACADEGEGLVYRNGIHLWNDVSFIAVPHYQIPLILLIGDIL